MSKKCNTQPLASATFLGLILGFSLGGTILVGFRGLGFRVCLPVGRRGLPRTCLSKLRSLFRHLPEKLCCGFGMQSGARVLAELIVHVRILG